MMAFICPKTRRPFNPLNASLECGHCRFGLPVRITKEIGIDYSCRYYEKEGKAMTDALDELKPCPMCNRAIMISIEGLYCPDCDYTYYQEENETLVQTAERFNADRDNIAREIAFEVVE